MELPVELRQKGVATHTPEEEDQNICEETKALESSAASKSPNCEKFECSPKTWSWLRALYRDTMKAQHLRTDQRFTFQHDSGPKYSDTQEWLSNSLPKFLSCTARAGT